ncbi:MAG: nucleotidyltransferase domain-containing protein [Roseburia sp.]|nr:nucleotidyltransferase domain-containing protein [Roseburia sp.]
MLVGNETALQQLMDQASFIAERENFTLVFAAVQGSISRGLQRYDSDYDIRFLYKRKGTFKIDDKTAWSEKNVVLRYYPEQDTFFDKIAFWDIEAFVSFLFTPELDQKGISVGLYNQFFWTFSSPYNWDPYGIAGKIMPIANAVINIKWLTAYFIDYVKKILCRETLFLRDYIYCILGIWQLMWLHRYRSYPPLDYYTLKYISNDAAITELTDKYVAQLKSLKKQTFVRKNFSHVPVDRNPGLDKWIKEKMLHFDSIMSCLTEEPLIAPQIIPCLNELFCESFKEKTVRGIV